MAALQNARWEMFALGIAAGRSQMRAYIDAGYSENSSANASTLAKREEIHARVAELIEERTQFRSTFVDNGDLEHIGAVDKARTSGEIDRNWIIEQLMENVKKAADAGQFSASNQALRMLGEEIGMFGSKKSGGDVDLKVPPPSVNQSIDVASVNKLLSAYGYEGPPIDLTKRQKVVTINDQSH